MPSLVEAKLAEWFLLTAEVLDRPIVELPLEELRPHLLESFDASLFTANLRDARGAAFVKGYGRLETDPTSTEVNLMIRKLFTTMDLRLFDFHPLLQWYARSGQVGPQSMQRVPKSLVESWESHEVLHVLQGVGVHHQLSIPMLVNGIEHHAVVLSRPRGKDFTDDDLQLARWLQPMFTALQRQAQLLASRAIPSELVGLLSGRELAVLRCIARGMTAQAAASALAVSPRTVEKHLEKTYRKMGVTDRVSAVLIAREMGLVEPIWHSAPPTGGISLDWELISKVGSIASLAG